MRNKNNKRKLLTANIYDAGGTATTTSPTVSTADKIVGGIGAATSLIGDIAQSVQTPNVNGIESKIKDYNNRQFAATDNAALMAQYNSLNPLENQTYESIGGVSNIGIVGNTLKGAGSGAALGSMFGPIGTGIGAGVGAIGSLAGSLVGKHKTEDKVADLNTKIAEANQRKTVDFARAAGTVDINKDLSLMSNYYKCGGRVNTLANGGSTHGIDWNYGFTQIDNGGSHEENPMGGVQMGVDNQGIPNLVEQGEVKWNDYIFSKKLKADKKDLTDTNLNPTFAGKSFADIAKRINKEGDERPNDPISKNGRNALLTSLMMSQESLKNRTSPTPTNNTFAEGGGIHINPEHRGLFTSYAKSHGMGVQEMASHVLANKEDYSSAIVKRANFAKNAAGWKHAAGGFLDGDKTYYEEPIYLDQPGYTPPETYVPGPANVLYSSDTSVPTPQSTKKGLNMNTTMLRYAPAIGSAMGVLGDVFGITNKPDYQTAKMIADSTSNLREVGYNPIGNYLTYKPLDRNYYANQLRAQSGATRRTIANSSNPNTNAALLSAGYNSDIAMGNLARQAEEYNAAQRERVAGFNRQTDMFNRQNAIQAAQINKANDELRLRSAMTQAELMNKEDRLAGAGRTSNINTLFENLGGIGSERAVIEMIQSNPALLYQLNDQFGISYKKPESKKRNGGYLTIKNRK